MFDVAAVVHTYDRINTHEADPCFSRRVRSIGNRAMHLDKRSACRAGSKCYHAVTVAKEFCAIAESCTIRLMNDFKTFTLEYFRAFVDNMLDDEQAPLMIAEGRHYVAETAKFDMDFAKKLGLVVSSLEDVLKYARDRRERS